ncbi:hypothetical protein [Nocardia sp. NPDC004750]
MLAQPYDEGFGLAIAHDIDPFVSDRIQICVPRRFQRLNVKSPTLTTLGIGRWEQELKQYPIRGVADIRSGKG